MKDKNLSFVLYLTFRHNLHKVNALGTTFLQISDSFPKVVSFYVLEIVVDRQDGFFIAHKFLSSQKTDAITFLADGTFFAFFGISSPDPVHFFDCCFISSVYWWIQVSSAVKKRRKNPLNSSWTVTNMRQIFACDLVFAPEWANAVSNLHTVFSCAIHDAKQSVAVDRNVYGHY